MKREQFTYVVASFCLTCIGPAPMAFADGLMGGGGPPPAVQCLGAAEKAQIQAAIAAHETAHPHGTEVPRKFPFYPLGATLYRDVFTNNFVDVNPTTGFQDWDCTDFTFDGHEATDVDVRTFTEQSIGVQIFSALDGTVAATHDGETDMHTTCVGLPNYVAIDHGGGRTCYYLHMKLGSVAVTPGQVVRAGHPIGLVGSSGCSTNPHLHFATYDNSGATLIEPYQGPCRPGESLWIAQTPIYRQMYIRDMNLTNVLIENEPGLPFDMPRTGTFVTGTQSVGFWINLMNMPGNQTWRVRYRRPNATIAFDSGTVNFNNPFHRWSWWYWRYNINLSVTGTWHILLDLGGQTVETAPFTVVATAAQIVNRPPNPITVAFDTIHPRIEDAIFCRVNTSLTLDDPDYQVVRYHYVWRVNGQVVRDVIRAGHADAIPRFGVCTGDLVECDVTPGDGVAEGPMANASMTVAPVAPIPGDMNGDGNVGASDVPQLVNVLLGLNTACESRITADINADAKNNGRDIAPFVDAMP